MFAGRRDKSLFSHTVFAGNGNSKSKSNCPLGRSRNGRRKETKNFRRRHTHTHTCKVFSVNKETRRKESRDKQTFGKESVSSRDRTAMTATPYITYIPIPPYTYTSKDLVLHWSTNTQSSTRTLGDRSIKRRGQRRPTTTV